MTKPEKPAALTVIQYRALEDLVLRGETENWGGVKGLVKRGYARIGEMAQNPIVTDAGRGRYAYLSRGPFCRTCGKPLRGVKQVERAGGEVSCCGCP